MSRLPMPGTELTALKLINDSLTLRNTLIHSDHILLTCDYNKVEGVTHKPMVMARYLSQKLGRLFLNPDSALCSSRSQRFGHLCPPRVFTNDVIYRYNSIGYSTSPSTII